eukprot:TRINITY_DN3967_c0_g1_i5.p1 TRINITY_DN3967_c0_g1~~TRINITY_DN3967_c0_g1_i5.p1  ORF type:complete len:539 (-),score=93.14 TRINITY_DN3967_c0_g1_i5:297-1913(-)
MIATSFDLRDGLGLQAVDLVKMELVVNTMLKYKLRVNIDVGLRTLTPDQLRTSRNKWSINTQNKQSLSQNFQMPSVTNFIPSHNSIAPTYHRTTKFPIQQVEITNPATIAADIDDDDDDDDDDGIEILDPPAVAHNISSAPQKSIANEVIQLSDEEESTDDDRAQQTDSITEEKMTDSSSSKSETQRTGSIDSDKSVPSSSQVQLLNIGQVNQSGQPKHQVQIISKPHSTWGPDWPPEVLQAVQSVSEVLQLSHVIVRLSIEQRKRFPSNADHLFNWVSNDMAKQSKAPKAIAIAVSAAAPTTPQILLPTTPVNPKKQHQPTRSPNRSKSPKKLSKGSHGQSGSSRPRSKSPSRGRLETIPPLVPDRPYNKLLEQYPELKGVTLRPVVIDGSNLACAHGRHATFSAEGLRLGAEYFHSANVVVKITIPIFRRSKIPPDQQKPPLVDNDGILDILHEKGILVEVPTKSYEDHAVVDLAMAMNAVIITNDAYADFKNPNLREYIAKNTFSFTLTDSAFLVSRQVNRTLSFTDRIRATNTL